MQSTGVTRRIDELGRIVIPKEIRRMLSIRDGENLEILVDENKIILKKYLVMQNLTELSQKIINILSTVGIDKLIITDREKVVATSDIYINLINSSINIELLKVIDSREIITNNDSKISLKEDILGSHVIVPIINETDCLGLVILIKTDELYNKDDIKILKIVSKLISEKINLQ